MPLNVQREISESRGGPEVSCWGKVRFEPDKRALAAKVASRMAKSKGSRIMPFRCPHCGGWHVGQNLGLRQRKAPAVRRGLSQV
jgi:hypothetical protein